MALDESLVYGFFLIFVRCSAMLLSSPMFGAQNTPLSVRILTTLSISAALTFVLKPHIGDPPADLYSFAAAVANEALAGLLIGAFLSMVLHAAQIAGSVLDLQLGLSMSQTLNPVTGVPVTVAAQYKYFLCLTIFLGLNAHHVMFAAFARSYEAMPTLGLEMLPLIKTSLLKLLQEMTLLALQMAAPVAAVSLVVDAALGLVNKAVPQMQTFVMAMPAKVLIGLITLSLGLPALVGGVSFGVERATEALFGLFGGR
jgi:flagellar biosynthesis protein FliR